jgi:hypothetical protein
MERSWRSGHHEFPMQEMRRACQIEIYTKRVFLCFWWNSSVEQALTIALGHNSSSSNPAGPRQAALRASCRDPAGGPFLISHRVQTCKLAVPAPSALAPQLFREELSHLFARDRPGLGCFAFLPFCQCVSFNSVLAQ